MIYDKSEIQWKHWNIWFVVFSSLHHILFFSLCFPCDMAILFSFCCWSVWERNCFRILKLAQEHAAICSLTNQVLHVIGYATKVPPVLISGKECSQASPLDRCTILLSIGSCKYMTKNVPRKLEKWLVLLALKRILVPHQIRQVWIIISPYFVPHKIPLVFEQRGWSHLLYPCSQDSHED